MKNIMKIFKSKEDYRIDFLARSTYNTNKIEGSTVSLSLTTAILTNDNSFKINNVSPREVYEIINHKKALDYMFQCLENDGLFSENFIIKINTLINENVLNTTGYRELNVYIKGANHIPTPYEEISNKMMYYIDNYNNTKHDNIYEKIAYNHIEFEKIHPFQDGNGRTGRLLINYELIKNNLTPIIIPATDREKYFDMLEDMNVEELANYIKSQSELEKQRIQNFIN